MEKFELIAPCHFGMEAVLKREILDLGYEIVKVEDGKVTFEAVPRVSQMPMSFCAPQKESAEGGRGKNAENLR